MHRRVVRAAALAIGFVLLVHGIALGHEAPDEGSEWLMADWMLLSFLVFIGIGLLAFIVVLRRGLQSTWRRPGTTSSPSTLVVAGSALADSCLNVSRAPAACGSSCSTVVVEGNWLWLPSLVNIAVSAQFLPPY